LYLVGKAGIRCGGMEASRKELGKIRPTALPPDRPISRTQKGRNTVTSGTFSCSTGKLGIKKSQLPQGCLPNPMFGTVVHLHGHPISRRVHGYQVLSRDQGHGLKRREAPDSNGHTAGSDGHAFFPDRDSAAANGRDTWPQDHNPTFGTQSLSAKTCPTPTQASRSLSTSPWGLP
jgi:hypothetical protein